MQKVISFNDVAIVSVKGSDHRNHFLDMSKDDAMSKMNNSNLNECVITGVCCKLFIYIYIYIYIYRLVKEKTFF